MLKSSVENESFYDLLVPDRVYFWVLLESFETLRKKRFGILECIMTFFFL